MSTNKEELTVSDFLDLADELVEEELDNMVEQEEQSRFQRMKEQLQTELKGYVVPDAFYDMVFKQIIELLNIEISDLLTDAWSKYKELAKYRNEKQYPPNDTFYSPLVAHTFTSTHNPLLRPTINRIALGSIKITAEFSLKLNGVLLQIKAGKIEGFTVGECVGSGRLSVQGVEMIQKKSKPWRFPKMYTLANPLLIPDIKQVMTTNVSPPATAASKVGNKAEKNESALI